MTKTWDEVVEGYRERWIEIFSQGVEGFSEQACREIVTALERKTEWIPVKWHEITEAEREEEGYPKEWLTILDCEMPEDGQEILVTTRQGTVEADTCYEDGEFGLDSGYDWIDDIVAWMPLPEPYKGEDDE